MRLFRETFGWDILMRHFNETFWWNILMKHFDESCWRDILIRTYDDIVIKKLWRDIWMRHFISNINLFLHNSYGTPKFPDCGTLFEADWVENLRLEYTKPYVPFWWVHIRNRPCIMGRSRRNPPCILGGTIQNSCLAKC